MCSASRHLHKVRGARFGSGPSVPACLLAEKRAFRCESREKANECQASHRSTSSFQTPFARSQLQTSQSRLGSADNIFDDTLPLARISSTAKSQLQSVCRTGQRPPALPLMLPRSFALRRSAQRWRRDTRSNIGELAVGLRGIDLPPVNIE